MGCIRMAIWATVLSLMIAGASEAAIMSRNSLEIDFTKPDEAQAKCICSPPDKLTITNEGLGWAGSPAGSRDGSVQTQPIGVGLSWRPITAMTCRVEIQPASSPTTLPNGHSFMPDPGMVYVRYSPDQKHWSSWQALQH